MKAGVTDIRAKSASGSTTRGSQWAPSTSPPHPSRADVSAQLCVRIGFTMAASNAAKRLMIFGGTGFVGSAIAREAAKRGLLVQCVTRGGDAPAHLRDEPWASSVTWLRGDALDPSSYKEHMRGADAVITSVGRLPFPNLSHEDIVRDNGETNVTPAKCAKEVGVDRLVVIGASVPPIPGVGWGISPTSGVYAAGYAAGKAMAETHARDEFVGAGHGGRGAAVLKPGPVSGEFILICSSICAIRLTSCFFVFLTGTRITGSGSKIPLWAAFGPMAAVMNALPLPAGMKQMTPVSVDNVARAAVTAATNDSYAGKFTQISNAELIERYDE